MRCEMALGQMLEADSTALRGMDGSQLARHIGRCSGCARVAATLLDETGAVDRALTDYAEARAADASADAALEAIRAEAGVGPSTHPGDRRPPAAAPAGRRSRGPGRWTRHAWVPLAAAAALAAVLVLSRDPVPFPGDQAADGPGFEPRVSVAPPADRGAAIMETENPNITIVWLYEREGS